MIIPVASGADVFAVTDCPSTIFVFDVPIIADDLDG